MTANTNALHPHYTPKHTHTLHSKINSHAQDTDSLANSCVSDITPQRMAQPTDTSTSISEFQGYFIRFKVES